MACPHCGCRLVSPSQLGPDKLVCSDCGRPMDGHLRRTAHLAGWPQRGSAALLVLLGLSALALFALRDGLGGNQEGMPAEPSERSRSE